MARFASGSGASPRRTSWSTGAWHRRWRNSGRGGASVAYVKEQMGHSSIQVTCDIYGHLVPGANVAWVDGLDAVERTSQQPSATPAQPASDEGSSELDAEMAEVLGNLVDGFGGGEWTRTTDLRIMRPWVDSRLPWRNAVVR